MPKIVRAKFHRPLANRRGFTFVEILLVSVLISLIGIAIFNSFSSGLKLWKRTQRFVTEEDIVIFFDKFSEDARNAFYFSKIKFSGTSDHYAFPSFVLTDADSKSSRALEGLVDQIGRIEYRFDFSNHRIIRNQANYSDALKDNWTESKTLVGEIDALEFGYYYPGNQSYIDHTLETFPSGIFVEIHFKDQSDKQRNLHRFIPIPVGI